jgi:two-component system, NarL family, response regulator DevR
VPNAWAMPRAKDAKACERGYVVDVHADAGKPDKADSIRVFLLDDHELVRRGVAEMLSAEPDIEVAGQAGSVAQALPAAEAARPDVALLDVRLPDGSGIEVCRELKSRMPRLGCLMLTSFSDDDALFGAIMAGAAGYVLKDIRGSALVDAVRTVARGGSLLDPTATERLLSRLRVGIVPGEADHEAAASKLASLTISEKRILELIAEGLTNRQIGERLNLAEKTVKNYVTGILAKLAMQRRTQAAAFAVRHLPGRSQ